MPLKFGTEMGRWRGTPFYSSHYESADENDFEDGYTDYYQFPGTSYRMPCGAIHQCVAGARRALLATEGVSIPDVGMAYSIFEFTHFHKIELVPPATPGGRPSIKREPVPVIKCKNGEAASDPRMAIPRPGMVIIWHAGGFFQYTGHVGIIADVLKREDDATFPFRVRVAEQNVHDESWEGRDYSRELKARINGKGHFEIHEVDSRVKGWIAPITASFLQDAATASITRTDAAADVASPALNNNNSSVNDSDSKKADFSVVGDSSSDEDDE